MLLTLLVVGVSGAWASVTYTVEYKYYPSTSTNGNYSLNFSYLNVGLTDNTGDNAYIHFTRTSRTQLTVSYAYYSSWSGYTDYSNPSRYGLDEADLYNGDWVKQMISATSIDGYESTIDVDDENHKITITYAKPYIEGDLKFIATSNNTVSVELNLTKTKEVTDTITRSSTLWNHNNIGESASTSDGSTTYTYIGDFYDKYVDTKYFSSTHYTYERKHTVTYSDAESVTIPATVTIDGKPYQVTSIADQGFVYGQSYQWIRSICRSGNTIATYQYLTMEARNDYLKHVYFDPDCQITSIGSYAFIACTVLEDITIPKSVVTIGEGAFECCVELSNLQFQTEDNGTSALRTIDQYAFYGCRSVETIDLPEGLTTIGTYTFTYNFKLVNIKLPNTLTTIGAHFLCCASSLQTLVIPASVTTIDGALFHGCESLREVYLLGEASALQAVSGDGNNTFGYNNYYCLDKVSDCTFYTTSDYITSYANQSAWALIADNRDSSGYLVDEDGNRIKNSNNQDVRPVGTNQNNGNKMLVIQPITQKFAYKWVTACFPEGLENYKDASKLGPDAMVAEMVAAEAVGGDPYVYHLTFRLIPGDNITAGRPYLVCPSEESINNDITIMDAVWQNQHKEEMTALHSYNVTADNGAKVYMNSYYTNRQLQVGDFYFASTGQVGPNKKVGNFWKVTDAATAPTLAACKCYWEIMLDGVQDLSQAKMAMVTNFWDEADGIEGTEKPEAKIVIDGIYDLNGNKLNLDYDALAKGLYIVNGKKVVKK